MCHQRCITPMRYLSGSALVTKFRERSAPRASSVASLRQCFMKPRESAPGQAAQQAGPSAALRLQPCRRRSITLLKSRVARFQGPVPQCSMVWCRLLMRPNRACAQSRQLARSGSANRRERQPPTPSAIVPIRPRKAPEPRELHPSEQDRRLTLQRLHIESLDATFGVFMPRCSQQRDVPTRDRIPRSAVDYPGTCPPGYCRST